MAIKIIQKIKKSIFFKLVAILVFTGMLINFAVSSFYHFHTNSQPIQDIKTHINNYATYIVNDIGNPPDIDKAKKIAAKLSLKIKYMGKNSTWSTHDDFPEIKKKVHSRKKIFHKNFPEVNVQRGIVFYTFKKNNDTFIFSKDTHRFFDLNEVSIFILLMVLTLIIIGSYLMIRRVLKPIKLLTKGVQEIAEGNLDHKIIIKNKDELGELTDSFNDMSSKIKKMIKSKNQLLLDVSHELRSPLTRIKVALEFLTDENHKNSINDDVSEIESMIAEILESERLNNDYGKIQKADVNLINIINEIYNDFNNSAPGLRVEKKSQDYILKADKDRMTTALKNIIENAMKFSRGSDKPVEISINKTNTHIEIIIIDFGIGISEEDLKFIFEPFYKADRSRSKDKSGYGLGMNLSKKIIEAHGGTIEITSQLQKGTTVKILLP